MSDSVNVSTERPRGVSSSRGQDRPGGVSVSSVGVSAGPAFESSLRQRQGCLGSRPAFAARHRCVGGRHNHHRSACPLTIGNQFAFGNAVGVIGCLARHRGQEQKLRAEVIDSDHLMGGDDLTSPLAGRVLALPGDFLVQSRGLLLSGLVSARRFLAGFGFTSDHAALIFRELACCGFRVPGNFEVELWFRGGSDRGHTPIDPDHALNFWQRLVAHSYNEAGVPVPERIPVHPNTGRFAGQFTRPHHRDQPAASQTQTPVFEAETVTGVLQTRQSLLGMLEVSPALTRERAQRLLLRGHRALRQPRHRGPRGSEVFTREECAVVFTRRNTLVPNPSRPVPLGQQSPLRHGSGPKPVVVAKHRGCGHHTNIFNGSDISRRRHMHQATTNGRPYLPIAKTRSISGSSR